MLLSSCYTTGEGALTGAHFGSMVGGILGGLNGGWRGHEVGTLVGMATGAATGAAVGHASEQSRKNKIERYHRNMEERAYAQQRSHQNYDESGFDSNNTGNDVIDFSPSSNEDNTYYGTTAGTLSVSKIYFNDENKDFKLHRKEKGEISFEMTNNTNKMMFNVMPVISEVNGNKHILISPSAKIESIAPGKSIRYTAMVIGDGSLKAGTADFCIEIYAGSQLVGDPVKFSITTTK